MHALGPFSLFTVVEFGSYLVVAITLIWRPHYWRRFVILAVAGFLGEESCITLYRWYGYSDQWRVMLHWTPLAVIVVWPVVIIASWEVARRLSQRGSIVALLTAGLVLWDTTVMEPVATAAGLWWWKSGTFFGVPILGLFGWGLFALVATPALDRFGERNDALLWLPPALALGTQLLLAPLVFLAVVTEFRFPLSHTHYQWVMVALTLGLTTLALWARPRTDVTLAEILPKVLGAAIFFIVLYAMWFEPLLLYCSLAPIPYWALAFRLRRTERAAPGGGGD